MIHCYVVALSVDVDEHAEQRKGWGDVVSHSTSRGDKDVLGHGVATTLRQVKHFETKGGAGKVQTSETALRHRQCDVRVHRLLQSFQTRR